MKALWLENNQVDCRDMPQPSKPGEALVRILLAGICSTDLELVKGYYPYTGVLGHEFVGEIVSCEDRTRIGQRVVGEITVTCGQCEACQKMRRSHCENRNVLGIVDRDGVFAEYTTLPLENLHYVPSSVPDEIAVFTEPLAAALEIQQQIHIYPSDRVLLIGAGRLGQLIAQTLALTGCDLGVVACHANQKSLLRGRGIGLISAEDVQPGHWDLVVEATGSPDGFTLARRAIRPRGRLVMKSTYKGDMQVNFSSIVVDEITIVGSRCGPFAPALRLMEMKAVDPTPLIAAEYKLGEGTPALEEAARAGVLKVLLRP